MFTPLTKVFVLLDNDRKTETLQIYKFPKISKHDKNLAHTIFQEVVCRSAPFFFVRNEAFLFQE